MLKIPLFEISHSVCNLNFYPETLLCSIKSASHNQTNLKDSSEVLVFDEQQTTAVAIVMMPVWFLFSVSV